MFSVDVLTVVAPEEGIDGAVLEALKSQGSVRLEHHVVEGTRQPGEIRGHAIDRARNRAKRLGSAHYALFLDSDVVLPPRGIERLIFGLLFNPRYAALAINYGDLDQCPGGVHIAMGATLFIRPILDRIRFRREPGTCECYCCCLDIRRMGYCIDYLPGLRARHLKRPLLPREGSVPSHPNLHRA